MTALLIIIAIAVLIFLYIFKTQREFVSLEEKMKNAYGQINVQQKTRWDAVTNLVEMTKQYTQHEHDTLVDVISKRRIDNATPEQIADQDNAIQSVLSRLNAVAEAYPDLKANQMFIDTMASIRQYEENVRTSRMVYNGTWTSHLETQGFERRPPGMFHQELRRQLIFGFTRYTPPGMVLVLMTEP